MKNVKITEGQLDRILKNIVAEQEMGDTKSKKKDKKPRCIPENVVPLDELAGKADEYSRYAPGVSKRGSGGIARQSQPVAAA